MSDIVERLMDEDVENRHGASAVLLGQLLGEAADEIERLRAERDALAKDAARYRWLRTAYFSGNSAYTLVGPTRTAEELDTRIDAAVKS